MAYEPLWIVEAWPADDLEGEPTLLNVINGTSTCKMYEPISSCDLTIPDGYDVVIDDYSDFAVQLLQRGTRIRIRVAEDGDFDGLLVKVVFDGFIHEVVRDPVWDNQGLHQDIILHCSNEMAKARSTGLNLSRQTKMLILEGTFDSDDFSAADTNFLVNIPCDSLSDGFDFVPQLMLSLYCAYDEDGEEVVKDYGKDEYSYGASNKIIYFHESQEVMKTGSGIWHWRLYYFDPDDETNSVKNLVTAIATGDPRSDQGGLGFDGGDVELEEITGFAEYPKLIRDFTREKTDGPVMQAFDDLRETGLLPYNYWLRVDPADRKLKGDYIYQETDSGILVPAFGVLNYSHNTMMEGVFSLVEVYSQALTPRNYALGASVSINVPGGYTVVLPGADGSEIIDGRADTFCCFQYTAKIGPDYQPVNSDNDAMLIDLGEVQDIRTVMLRLAMAWSEGLDGPHRVYLMERHPRITVSASTELIDENNPGIPINDDAISHEADYQNAEEWLKFECENITRLRYLAIRWEQDAFFRSSDSPSFPPGAHAYRTSVMGAAEIKILGDGRFRYDKLEVGGNSVDHPDKGRVPYCEIKGADQVTTIAAVTDTTHFTLANTAFAEIGDIIQVKHGSNDPVMCRVSDKVGDEITVDPEVPGVAEGDPVGEYNRWMLGFDWLYHDMYKPKLRIKLLNTTEWTEIIDNEAASEIEEAEQLAVEKILESIGVTADHAMEIPLDISIDVSSTVRPYPDEEPWVVTECDWSLNPVNAPSRPPVTMRLRGSDFEAVAQ